MASPIHLNQLKKNLEQWNLWRKQHPDIKPDLSNAYLCAAPLSVVDLSHACLTQADFYAADLWCADLHQADAQSANLSGVSLSGANLAEADCTAADFSGADLSQADLQGGTFHQANFSMANLSEANLSGADLTAANLKRARLVNANLTGANLTGANLTGIMVADIDISISFIASLKQVNCDHIYVMSQFALEQPESEAAALARASTYTTHFRSALHQVYQQFAEVCNSPTPQQYRLAWPTTAQAPDVHIQSVERQENGSFVVRLGLSNLQAPASAPAPLVSQPSQPSQLQPKPDYRQLLSRLGRGDYYFNQLRLREEQLATYRRQNDELLSLLKVMSQQHVYVQSVSVLENSVMSGVSKYDFRGATIGSFADTIESGGRQQSIQHNAAPVKAVPEWTVAAEIEQLLSQLAQQAAQVPPHQRPQVVANALEEKAKENPTFKARFLKAIESSSTELMRIFTSNPYVSLPMALVKGWVSAT